MKPYNYKNFTYSGISVSSECSFFPVLNGFNGELALFDFNQGYVFNYPSAQIGGAVPYIEVSGMGAQWEITSGDIFYLKLTLVEISKGSTEVSSAELIRSNTAPLAAANIFYIKVCKFGEEGSITEIFLRDNIYWTGFEGSSVAESIPTGSGVMYGDGITYQFLPYPVGSQIPYVLTYNGSVLDWVGTTGCA